MDILYPVCCGLDVHQTTVTACLRRVGRGGHVTKALRTVGTTAERLTLADWLIAAGCTPVAMERTAVFWTPVFTRFEGQSQQVLVLNAQHGTAVPGRKTDPLDAEGLAQLLPHGLLRGSFIPPARGAMRRTASSSCSRRPT